MRSIACSTAVRWRCPQARFRTWLPDSRMAGASKALAGPRNAGLVGRLPEAWAWAYTMAGGENRDGQ